MSEKIRLIKELMDEKKLALEREALYGNEYNAEILHKTIKACEDAIAILEKEDVSWRKLKAQVGLNYHLWTWKQKEKDEE